MAAVGEKEQPAARGMRADARRNRDAIIAAARELFAAEGDGVEMADIAERAELGVGTLYRHFPDKQALIRELVAARFVELAACYRQRLASDDPPWGRLEGAIRDACAIQARDRGLAEALSASGLADHQPVARSTPGLVDSLDRLVSDAVADGSARAGLTWEDVVMVLCGAGHAISSQRYLPGQWERLLEIQLDGLRAAR
jgi:AcrR family transcriptional regulator